PPNMIMAYTDGSCIRNEGGETMVGAGIWLRQNDPKNRVIHLPNYIEQTNNMDETVVILAAVQNTLHNQALLIKSDSQVTIDSLTKHLQKREDDGWIGTVNKNILRPLAAILRK
ncbi:Ribonuclease H, partial [Termitomyces sp. J132]